MNSSRPKATAAVAVALDALEVVIVHKPLSCRASSALAVGSSSSSNHCCCQRRKRHNATQTPQSAAQRCCCCPSNHRHCHHHQHRHHHCHYQQRNSRRQQRRQQQQQQKQLLLCAHKSSLEESSEEHAAAIAIEIDAATITEHNSSTATSNFPYKVASEGGGAPMKLTPLAKQQQRQQRRASLNSNTTIETDELSHDDDEDVQLGAANCTTARNECVRIKRKRFAPEALHDYCSSCSSCSCGGGGGSGQAHSSGSGSNSCSHSSSSLAAEYEDEGEDCQHCQHEQSSLKSYDSCCCSDDADEEDTTGQRESFCTAVDHTIVSGTPTPELEHSSTLTPLSSQQEQTMRDSDATSELEASSLSQSAEYYSLSSNIAAPPAAAVEAPAVSWRKQL